MPFYKRGFLYLVRKYTKSVLLLLVLFVSNSMILCTNMILHATESTESDMQKKAGTKVVCEISNTAYLIEGKEAEIIKNLTAVTSINRMGEQSAYLTDLVPITANSSEGPDNQKVNLLSYDDMYNDSPFADKSYRLTSGELIKTEMQYVAVVNAQFADFNGLQIGDTLSFSSDSGKTVTVEVIGEYLAGNESQQENSTPAVYRMENQIYIDDTAYLELFDNCGFYKVSAYTDQPEQLKTLAESIQGIVKDKADVTTSDALYQQMKAPLTQITRVVGLMRILTILTGTVIVSLLLCMWMRSRQKEMAVLISLGERKYIIVLQALLEAATVFLIALGGSCGFGMLAAKQLQRLLLASVELELALQVSLQFSDIALMMGIGSSVIVIAVLLSLLPVIITNPKDILSKMEG